MPPNNILLLMTDQQRWDSLGIYGCDGAHTPHLDRLGAEGLVFDSCTVNNTICTPSRASLMTGKHLPEHGVLRLYDDLPRDQVLFTEYLRQYGYRNALFGKLHVSSSAFEHQRRHPHDGFDVHEFCMEGCSHMDSPLQTYARWLRKHHPAFHDRLHREGRRVLHHPQEVHLTRWVADRAIRFLRDHDRSRPFFCKASIFDPHNPYQDYPLEMRERIRADRIPEPLRTDEALAATPQAVRRQECKDDALDPERLREDRIGYHASIAFADQEFGRILQTLDDLDLAGNTWVFFLSDHGDMLGDRRLRTKGGYFYEPCVHVPLLIRPPRGRGRFGRRIPALVQPHDLAATILGIAGMSTDEIGTLMPDALDLRPLCLGDSETGHQHAVCCYRNSGLSGEPNRTPYFDPPIHGTMIRDDRYKLALFHEPDDLSGAGEGELFDLADDPQELRNLWHDRDHAPIRERLLEHLRNWLRTHSAQDAHSDSDTAHNRSKPL